MCGARWSVSRANLPCSLLLDVAQVFWHPRVRYLLHSELQRTRFLAIPSGCD